MTRQCDQTSRRILCVFPRYAPSFGTFEYAYPLTDGVRAFMPPQGLLVIAAVLPKTWEVRFVDENMAPATREDFTWADAVFVSGMHIQRRRINEICARAHAVGRTAVLGGPSVSAAPENYPDFDYLHVGELGDATDELVARLQHDPSRPARQIVLTTRERRPLTEFPLPAYELAHIPRYFIGSIQFSSGCPDQCEFCDIPALYGRNPRIKTPEQITAELDKLVACGAWGSVYFVDDNLIANRRALRELLPHLIAWQERNGYALTFACEATLNIAKRPDILALMREAAFFTVFCGIETPEPAALKAMAKDHNLMVPILDGVATLNRYGMEVVAEQSKIPLLTINLLQALPKTSLWDRLRREGRLIEDDARESNVDFKLPYDTVLAMWQECMARAYEPAALLARYQHQISATYPNRRKLPASPQRASWRNIGRALRMLRRVLWLEGFCSDYRWQFWRIVLPRLARADIERVITIGLVGHHLIRFAREASAGRQNASHYASKLPELSVAAE